MKNEPNEKLNKLYDAIKDIIQSRYSADDGIVIGDVISLVMGRSDLEDLLPINFIEPRKGVYLKEHEIELERESFHMGYNFGDVLVLDVKPKWYKPWSTYTYARALVVGQHLEVGFRDYETLPWLKRDDLLTKERFRKEVINMLCFYGAGAAFH